MDCVVFVLLGVDWFVLFCFVVFLCGCLVFGCGLMFGVLVAFRFTVLLDCFGCEFWYLVGLIDCFWLFARLVSVGLRFWSCLFGWVVFWFVVYIWVLVFVVCLLFVGFGCLLLILLCWFRFENCCFIVWDLFDLIVWEIVWV